MDLKIHSTLQTLNYILLNLVVFVNMLGGQWGLVVENGDCFWGPRVSLKTFPVNNVV